jgi:hypothetical protein
VLNIGTRRQLSSQSHIPTRILDVLFLYLLIASGVLGYLGKGEGDRRRTGLLIVLFAIDRADP